MKAPPGKCIVSFHKYRREGVIIVPDKHQPQSVECTVICDSGGEWEGLDAIASLMDGIYFEHENLRYCVLKRKSILMFFTEKDGKIATLRPATRAVIIEDQGRVEKVDRFYMPENDNRTRPYGKVLAVGPGRWDFKEGDTIHFDASRAVGIAIDGKKALFVFEDWIYAMEEAA